MIGWRKLSAWLLVYVLVAVSTFLQRDVLPNAKEVIIWASGFFFVANATKPMAQGIKINLGGGGNG